MQEVLRDVHRQGLLCRLRYMSRKGRIFLFEEGQKVDTVAAGCGVTRMAAAGSRSSETEEYFPLPEVGVLQRYRE